MRVGTERDTTNELSSILARAYLRLLAHYGSNWPERFELGENTETEESSENCSVRLDFRGNRSIRCTGGRTITLTLTRS